MIFEVVLRTPRQETETLKVEATSYTHDGQFTNFWQKLEESEDQKVATFKTSLVHTIREVEAPS